MILSDNETKVDLLNNEAIATTIVKLLRERPDRPITIGVHGDWGAGKSSVLEMIESKFDGAEDVLCLKFNGWRFQGFEDAKIALIEGIVSELVKERPLLTKAGDAVKDIFRRIDVLKVAKKVGGLALTLYTGIPTPDMIQTAVNAIDSIITDPMKYVTKESMTAAMESVKSVLKPAESNKSIPKEIAEFRAAFDDLLKKAGIKQLIVLVDDLDRCLPETAIETLEAIRLFVFTSHTAFVIAADEAMIEYAVRKHFPELPDATGPQTYARNYLEKLIQVPFRIPTLGETETRIYVTLLLVGADLGEEDAEFLKLIAVARDKLKRPWTAHSLDAATVNTTLGSKAPQVQSSLTLSDQIAPILASGAKGNPRQIKRFLNTLVLRQRTAEARGFGSDVKTPVLAKLMLAERFIPTLFDHIAGVAAVAPDGMCHDLNALEAALQAPRELETRPKAVGKKTAGKNVKDSPDGADASSSNSTVAGWLATESICSWTTLAPQLTGTDLRPYLFVAKDRKDYFGSTSALGKLATIVEQLLGPKIIVQSMIADLQRLAAPEAAQIFESLRSRIIAGDVFDTQPRGIDGLSVLVTAHPELQSNLLDFFEGLPVHRIGAWVVSGWANVIKDPGAKERFNRLLSGWAASNNPILKATAGTTLRIPDAKR